MLVEAGAGVVEGTERESNISSKYAEEYEVHIQGRPAIFFSSSQRRTKLFILEETAFSRMQFFRDRK